MTLHGACTCLPLAGHCMQLLHTSTTMPVQGSSTGWETRMYCNSNTYFLKSPYYQAMCQLPPLLQSTSFSLLHTSSSGWFSFSNPWNGKKRRSNGWWVGGQMEAGRLPLANAVPEATAPSSLTNRPALNKMATEIPKLNMGSTNKAKVSQQNWQALWYEHICFVFNSKWINPY